MNLDIMSLNKNQSQNPPIQQTRPTLPNATLSDMTKARTKRKNQSFYANTTVKKVSEE
jgi:hypothetical protein